jgi:DNA-binding MarR family transcriptional regulator
MFAPLPASVEDELAMSIAAHSGSDRSVSIIGFSSADEQAIGHSVEQAGGRVLRATADEDVPLADMLVIDALDEAAFNAAIVRAGSDHRLVVRASLKTVDSVVDQWPDADVVIGGDWVDLHLTLTTALRRSTSMPAATFDVASEEGLRLQRLADEIGRIARSLIDLPDGLASNGGGISDRSTNFRGAPVEDISSDGTAITAAEVRAIIRLRRMRDRFFPADLFADPAWDMLLDLAAARIERTRVAVSSLCIAAAVPPTTALRWIKAMTDKDLLQRVADPHDARRIFIQLSNDAAIAMEKYLRAARNGAGLII